MVRFNPLVETKELGRIACPKGKLSLFYALELARNYQMMNREISEKTIRYLMKTEKKQRALVFGLMTAMGIAGTERSYGVDQLEGVQAFWDKEYPETFRIVAFETGDAVKKYEVCVILDNGHWDGLKSVTQFFRVKYFCVSCEAVYDCPERHRIECRERYLHCDACNKDFYNEGCFEEHKKKACNIYHKWFKRVDTIAFAHYASRYDSHFVLAGAQKKIIEFQGCVFHGCPRCYRPWTKGVDGELMEEKFQRTEMKMARLRDICKNFTVEEVWECDVKAELKRNMEMKKFFDSVLDGPINPRDAYSGGRTMPFCLYAVASESVEISMFDIISLYPSVNYDAPYPVGIPKIVKRDEDVLWTEPDDVPYAGLLKVKVVPPKNLLYPLLPAHIDDMLLFPLCGVCATRAKKDFVMAKDEKKCEHDEEERALLGTYTSIELRKALELGYKVTHFFRAYHFEEFDSQLFRGGKYDIWLERENMKKNPGLRLIAKLGLNSLWGKFSMRNNLSEHDILKSGEEWAKILQDDRLLPSEPVLQKDGKTMRVAFKKKEDFVVEHKDYECGAD
uniref:DNA-directed DNA polymerase n=1 Tax=Globodera pallida TaxID=36090 RepID=A0A183CH55_GLOPA